MPAGRTADSTPHSRGRHRRFLGPGATVWVVWIYLVAYFSLIAGAVAALWRAGALNDIPAVWTVLALLVSVALGAVLALLFMRRTVPS